MSTKPVALTGIKPTGTPHLGNYLGAIRPALALARDYDAYYFIADAHALTTVSDAGRMRALAFEVAATWMACGLDPDEVVMYRQSDVPEVFELSWVLSCSTAKGLLNRAHAYKAAVEENQAAGLAPDDGVSAGLFTYPVLMAADIMIVDADVVPVGQDQRQHVEIARDVAETLNREFGEVLKVPGPAISEDVATVPGLDGRKMSKSYDNVIPLFVEPARMRKLVARIVTDSRRPEEPKDPETDTVFLLYRQFATAAEADALAARYRAGGMGYAESKSALADVLERTLAEPRRLYEELAAEPARVEKILREGAERARDRAGDVLGRVRDAVGFGPRLG